MKESDCATPWLHAECEPYAETATGYLGKKRATMLDNTILQRNPRPATQPRVFTAPADMPRDFTYGDNYRDFFNVGHALTGWSRYIDEQVQHEKSKEYTCRETDFLSLNRSAVAHGIYNAKSLRDFRDTHDVKRPCVSNQKSVEVKPAPHIADKFKTYGRKAYGTNKQENMQHLMSSHYQDEWIRSLPTRAFTKQSMPKYDYTKYYQNRTCDLRQFMAPTKVEDKSPLWQMSKFTRRAKPAISTFRSEKDADAAWKNYAMDRIGREGVQGQGVNIPSNNHKDFQHCA